MQTTTDSRLGRFILMLAHCAGMVDLVALPVWVGTLVAHRQLDPQRAGGLVTLFLIGGVAACLVFAPRFRRLPARWMATGGFAGAACAFVAAAWTRDFAVLAACHAIGGLSAGTALSFTHGTIGRSANPHRLFAFVGAALGVFALLFLGLVPAAVSAHGGATLFVVFSVVMLVAGAVCALAFPAAAEPLHDATAHPALTRQVVLCIAGICLMALLQAMAMAFAERIGVDHGFGQSAVHGVLLAVGLVNLLPAPLAALLQNRLSAWPVLLCGPVLQAVIVLTMTHSSVFLPYAVATAVLTAVMLFTHTFVFGLLARLDRSGRAVAATPAMVMAGAAIGPIVGGTLINAWGYTALGYLGTVVALCSLICFAGMRHGDVRHPPVAT
jgi:predicted MFS family arabinose efflux permease